MGLFGGIFLQSWFVNIELAVACLASEFDELQHRVQMFNLVNYFLGSSNPKLANGGALDG